MDKTIPADLLELKTRFDDWRANRPYSREPIPADLRQAVIEMSHRYPRALLRRVLKLDPWRLNQSVTKKLAGAAGHKKPQLAFFTLPTDAALPEPVSAPQSATHSRLQIERPDGARLTLTLHTLDLASINRLCADFLRG